jgi:hypothetical protein
MVGLPCLVCQYAKLHVVGWTWTVSTLVDDMTTLSSESVCQFARSLVDVGSFHTKEDGRTTMSSESVCQGARSWVDVGSFHTGRW